jgi:predicted short-subunit dehydrogenase-like oxidoreductase (DUF2520 family)
MLRGMDRRPVVAIVGAGNLGIAISTQLHAAGYKISEIVSRSTVKSGRTARLARRLSARFTTVTRPDLSAKLIWFSVPDREIAKYAKSFAASTNWKGKIAFHSSGALSSDELAPLRRAGAVVASVHPLMTFVSAVAPNMSGVPFAVEGDRAAVNAARRVVADLGGQVFPIEKKNKVAYHAWGAFASPLIVALLASAEQVARSAGIGAIEARKRMLPIIRQTVANYAVHGPAGAFSGPLIRGDVATVRQHLQLLRKLPAAKQVYVSLAKSAMTNLPVRNRAQLNRVLRSAGVSERRKK